MVKPSKGLLSGRTRRLKRKRRVTVADKVKTFKVNQKVTLTPESANKGRPELRYSGRHGIIVRKQGKSYVVKIRDGGKMKELVASAIHLKAA